jgi:hypothetical protein
MELLQGDKTLGSGSESLLGASEHSQPLEANAAGQRAGNL